MTSFDRRKFLLGALGFVAASCAKSDGSTLDGPTEVGPSTSGPSLATTISPTTVSTTTGAPRNTTTTAPIVGPARYVNRGNTTTKRVALTFHTEGTPAQVGRLLDMAKTLEVPLTLMIIGSWLDQNRSLGARIADSGHDIGNHTWSHLALPDQTRATIATEIRRCSDVLRDVTGSGGRWFRPSGSNSTTATINEEAAKVGYPIVLGFDVDPLDYQDPGSAAVRSRVVAGVQNGSLVSLHSQHQGTIDVFESMVGAIRDKGFTLVRAGDLV